MTYVSTLVREAHEARKARHQKWARHAVHDVENDTGLTDGQRRALLRRGGFREQTVVLAHREAEARKTMVARQIAASVEKQRRDAEGDGPQTGNLPPLPRRIIVLTAKHFRMSPKSLIGPRRKEEIVLARQISMYLMAELTTLSLTGIGRRFGNRDHTTVRHAVLKIRRLLTEDQSLRGTVDAIASKIP